MDKLLEEIFRIVESYANALLRKMITLLLLVSIGLTALAAGSVLAALAATRNAYARVSRWRFSEGIE